MGNVQVRISTARLGVGRYCEEPFRFAVTCTLCAYGLQSPQMPSSTLLVLFILPGVIWASFAYVSRSTDQTASRLRAVREAKTKKELTLGARAWKLFTLLTFAIVFWLSYSSGSEFMQRVEGPIDSPNRGNSHTSRGIPVPIPSVPV